MEIKTCGDIVTEMPFTPSDSDDESQIFQQWLASGTLRRRRVDLYADQAAADEMDELAAEIKSVERSPKPRTIDATNPLRDLKSRWNAAKERYEASLAVFQVVRLDKPIREQVAEEYPELEVDFRAPGSGATEKRMQEWRDALAAHSAAKAEQDGARTLAIVAYSIESLEIGGKKLERLLDNKGRVERPAVSIERLKAMLRTPYGDGWNKTLIDTVNEISQVAGEPDRPFLPEESGSDQD